ncbi:MAG: hypothetical protein IPJ12_00865 [Betaproteobacteria bacterium]|nr:hypothetical protein [Betaproteobacteria bacterium]
MWLLWLLLSARMVVADRGDAVTLSLVALAPLAAAWAVVRFGPRLILPLLSFALVPSVSIRVDDVLSLSLTPVPLHLLVVGIGCGGLFAARHHPEAWLQLVHRRRVGWLVPALTVLWLARFEWPLHSIRDLGIGLSIDVVSGLVTLLLVSMIDWRALVAQRPVAAHPRELQQLFWRFGVPGLLVLSQTLRTGVSFGMVGVAWSSVSAFGLVTAASLLGLLAGVLRARAWLAVSAVAAALEALRLISGLPPVAELVHEVRHQSGFDELGSIACDIVSVVLFAAVLRRFVERRRLEPGRWLWQMLAGIAMLQFVVAPLIDSTRATFFALSAGGWLIGGVAFAAVLARGAPALALVPLLLAAAVLPAALLTAGENPAPALLANAVGVSALAAMTGFIGMLVRRAFADVPAASTRDAAHATLDISRLAHFVQRLDTSATLRSFSALPSVLGVVAASVALGAFAVVIQSWSGELEADPIEVVQAYALALSVVLAPLAFIVQDGMNRQDRWRPVSALSGAVLAALGLAAASCVLVAAAMLPTLWLTDDQTARGFGVVALAVSVALLAGLLLTNQRRHQFVLGSMLGLAALIVPLFALTPPQHEDRSTAASALLLVLIAVGVALVLLVRGVRLRADLVGDVPRGLLFGEIAGGRLGPRLACLMGLPASMWHRAALRRPAFWALLLARPLVYAGVVGAWQGHALFAVVAVVGGHLLFEGGKRLAARDIWRPEDHSPLAPVLFLRSFEDDQLDLRSASPNPLRRWLALWSFRRNLDQAMVDEVACYGPVVALGLPGETRVPFGAARHYSTHDSWQQLVTTTARRAHTIVIVAGHTPGVRWEYALLARERLLDCTLLLFRPGAAAQADNRSALAAFPLDDAERRRLGDTGSRPWVALLHTHGKAVLLSADSPDPAAYVLALRAHFQRRDPSTLAQAAAAAPPPLSFAPWAAWLATLKARRNRVTG